MGIRGLYSYINKRSNELLEPFELKNIKVIIDGWSVAYQLFDLSQQRKTKYIIGGDYIDFFNFVFNFFKRLIQNKVEFIIVLNGGWDPKKHDRIMKNLKRCLDLNFNLFIPQNRKSSNHYAVFKDDVLMDVIKKLNLKYLKYTFNSDRVIATIAKILDCPILTANSNFFLYRNDCIIFHSLQFNFKNRLIRNEMACKIYRHDKFVKNFPGLESSCLPLLSVLLDQDYFTDDILNDFFDIKSTNDKMSEVHVKIEAAFKWLCYNDIHSAAEKILTLIKSINKPLKSPKKFIEDNVNVFTSTSKRMVNYLVNSPCLEINEEKIIATKNKFFKFDFVNKNKSRNENFCHHLIELNEDKLNKQFEDSVPDWFIKEYSMGIYDSFIVNLIVNQTYIPIYQLEDLKYSSAYEMCIPLITLLYRLVISCTKVKKINPLKLIIREKTDICCREMIVNKYPQRLEAMKKLNIKTRKKMINKMLNIKQAENFDDFPVNWRLFTATAVYWFKQNSEPPKNKIHLKALLLAMIFRVVERKIGAFRDYDSFFECHSKKIINILSKKTPTKHQNGKLTVTQAIKKVDYEDALIAANYLLLNVSNKTNISTNESSDTELSTTTIHIYSQFELCLLFSKNINALLEFPYYQTVISQIFARPLLYNLYIDISQHSTDADGYIAHKLESAPSVLRVFRILLKKIDLLLHE